jgi:hypothetical protein
MKSILIVLLLAAGGAAIYYFLIRNKPEKHEQKNAELIVGQWKIDSLDISHTKDSSANLIGIILASSDSNLHRYIYNVDSSGLVVETLNGKPTDTSYYKFTDEKNLLAWSSSDTSKTKWEVSHLDSARMELRQTDSTVFSFSKLR